MALFRKSKPGPAATDGSDDSATGGSDGADEPAGVGEPDDAGEAGSDHVPAVGERTAAKDAALQLRANGPFDASEVEDTTDLIDLGALLVTPVAGMELRLELNEEDGEHVVGVTALVADSAVQIQAFAAPRREGIWDEVRQEIAAGITQQGGTADESEGPFGAELLARVPGPGPDGRPGYQPARFVGVDGPRWFLRAVFTGSAVDQGSSSAGAIEGLVRSLVVVRGGEAMAPRELLPLRLPAMPGEAEGLADGQGDTAPDVEAPDAGRGGGQLLYRDDLKPFERGPEITEIH